MARPKIPVITRLLTKIEIPGIPDPSPYVEIPIADWPPELTEPQWRWVGAVAKARTVIVRVRGQPYFSHRTPTPSFVVDGKRVPAHRIMYSLFTGTKQSVRYYTKPVNYLDVNPAHWDPGPSPKRETAEQYNDRLMVSLMEIIHERIAVRKHLTKDLVECGYTPEQINAAIIAAEPPGGAQKWLLPTQGGSYVLASPEEIRR